MGSDVTASRPTWRTAFALPDSRLSVWEAESSYSAASPIAGIPVGTAGLRPVITGTPTSTDAIELETMRGGYSDGGAGFRWRFEGGDWLYQVPTPRIGTPVVAYDSRPTTISVDEVASTETEDGRPVMVIAGDTTGYRLTVTRQLTDGSWSSAVLIEKTLDAGVTYPAIVRLPDGQLDVYALMDGLRRFISTDDGATWTEVPIFIDGAWSVPGLYPGTAASGIGDGDRLAVAVGDGKMLLIIGGDPHTHYASEDYGSTWELVGTRAVVTVDTPIALTYTAQGFVFYEAMGEVVVCIPDAFSVLAENTYGWSGNSITPIAGCLYEHEGTLWIVEGADGDADARAITRWHHSTDGGRSWSTPGVDGGSDKPTDNGGLLTVRRLRGLAVAGGYLFEASNLTGGGGQAPAVVAHEVGGWSSLPALTREDEVVGWIQVYAPHPGVYPHTFHEVQVVFGTYIGLLAETVSGPSMSFPAAGGLQIDSTASAADEVKWTYTSEDEQFRWVAEADLAVVSGSVEVTCSSNSRRARVYVDADASTIGLYEATDHTDNSAQTLLGSTETLPAGQITVRVILNHDGASATASAWYRLDGSPDWVEVATNETVSATTDVVSSVCELRAIDDGSDLDAAIYGWRFTDERSAEGTLSSAETAGLSYAPWTSGGVYLDEGQSVQASGFTRYGDAWTSTPSADDGPGQLLPGRPSPRHRFTSDVDTVQTLAFTVEEQEMAPSHVLLLQGVNARTCKVDVWTTTAGAWVTYGTVNLYRGWDDYTVLGSNRVKLGTSTDAGSASLEHVSAGELVGATFVDSSGALFQVVGNTGGVLPQAGGGGHLGQRAILELDGTPAATGACELWFPTATAILHHEKSIVVEGFRLTFTGLVSASPQVASGVVTIGNAVLAPMTWLSEGPDQTRTEVFEVREEVVEQDDGHEYTVRYAPNRRRYELNFARLLPMYAAAGGSWDWWEAGDDTEQAATPWTLPQTLSSFLDLAGRRPFVYLPAIPYHSTSGQTLQTFVGSSTADARLVRCISGPFRLEGVLGQAATADQLVRGSTITLREVV